MFGSGETWQRVNESMQSRTGPQDRLNTTALRHSRASRLTSLSHSGRAVQTFATSP